MDGLSEFLAFVPDFPWGWFLLGPLGMIVLAIGPHLRFRYHTWRLHRRLQGQPDIFVEELREYEQAAGEEPEPLRWLPLLGSGFLLGALWAGSRWLHENGHGHWATVILMLLLLLQMAIFLWQRFNEPQAEKPDYEEEGYRPFYEVRSKVFQDYALVALGLMTLAVTLINLRA